MRQFVWGGQYIDEILAMGVDTNSDGDCVDEGGSQRYLYAQDANYNVVAVLKVESSGEPTIVER